VKTISLKKVSAVAVASLGFGLLSVVPVNAAVNTDVATTKVTAITLAKVTATPTANTAVVVNLGAATVATAAVGTGTDYEMEFQGYLESYPAGGSTSVAAVATATGTTTVVTGGTNAIAGAVLRIDGADNAALGGNTVVASATLGIGSFSFTPAKAGTYVVKVWHDADGDGLVDVAETQNNISITVVADAVYSNSLSTAFMRSVVADVVGATPDATSDAAGVSAPATKGGSTGDTENAADINVLIKNSSNAAMATGNTMAAEITGPGYLFWENGAVGKDKCLVNPTFGAATGRSLANLAIDADTYLYVCADGTPGVASIKITITDAAGTAYVLATKTVTFYGSVTKIAATGVLTVAASGGATLGDPTATRDTSAKTPSIIVKATDSANNPVSGLTFTYKSSDVTVMTETLTCNEDVKSSANVYSSGGKGFYNCRVTSSSGAKSGNKATLTVRTVDPAGDGTTFLTSDVAFTIGGSATTGTETIAFDKTSYAPGEAMVITRTAKDSSGNPVADFTASPAVSFSKAVGGTAPAAGVYVGGVSANATSAAKSGVFAPVTPGSFTVIATAANGATITATATVTDANAGIAASISALNAKIVALNALIAKIMKRLNIR